MEKENELWKDIVGYEGMYQVSSLGRIKSLEREVTSKAGKVMKIKPCFMKPSKHPKGYSNTSLWKGNKGITLAIHRIVGIHFIPNNENKPQINHKDGNKKNNIYTNLEWVDNSENQLHSYSLGLNHNPKRGNHSLAKSVVDICTGVIYPSSKDAADSVGLFYGTLRSMLRGRKRNTTSLLYTYK